MADWSAKHLMTLPVQDRLAQCPNFIIQIVDTAIKVLHAEKIWIFGSRARGDANRGSDFDLAFRIPIAFRRFWSSFFVDTQEDALTLSSIDLIEIDTADTALRNKILQEGILIYANETQ